MRKEIYFIYLYCFCRVNCSSGSKEEKINSETEDIRERRKEERGDVEESRNETRRRGRR